MRNKLDQTPSFQREMSPRNGSFAILDGMIVKLDIRRTRTPADLLAFTLWRRSARLQTSVPSVSINV